MAYETESEADEGGHTRSDFRDTHLINHSKGSPRLFLESCNIVDPGAACPQYTLSKGFRPIWLPERFVAG